MEREGYRARSVTHLSTSQRLTKSYHRRVMLDQQRAGLDHGAHQWRAVTVPERVRVGLLDLLDRLGLRFAACDFC